MAGTVKKLFAAVALLCLMLTAQSFAKDPPKVVVITAEQEYHAKETLPAFFMSDVEPRFKWKATFINSDSTTDIPNLDALDDADLLVMFLRRRTLPDAQLEKFKKYLARGKPLLALRTSSHAFQNWPTFDRDVLGCTYGAHTANDLMLAVRVAPGAEKHPILERVKPFDSRASLYRSNPLAKTATPLLIGKAGENPEQPVAWTNVVDKRRVFYTSLGHPDDFKTPEFKQLLINAIAWALDEPSK
jgi:type 1 glutamine amidotransferase